MPLESVYLNGGLIGVTKTYQTTVPGADTNPTTITVVNSGFTNGTNVTIPTVLDDDVMIICCGSINSGHTTDVPTGFSVGASTNGSGEIDVGSQIVYKKMTAAESGGTVSFGYYNWNRWIIVRLNDAFDIVSGSPNAESTRGDPVSQTISMSGVSTPVMGVATYAVNSGSYPSTNVSPDTSYNDTSVNDLFSGIWLFNSGSTPANRTWDASDGGRNAVTSCYIQFIPVAGEDVTAYNSGIFNLQAVLESLSA